MPLVPGVGAAFSAGVKGLGGVAAPAQQEWSVGSVDGAQAADGKGSFQSALSNQIDALSKLQDNAATASQSLADGTATDTTSVVMAVERARLSMQMASQLRTKGVEAINDIFHTTV